ncbi:MAG: dUTP diphosphatase [Pseudomonadales bacterium]|nr:dUTP diphosphatase [Pseudomonadales bacterium]
MLQMQDAMNTRVHAQWIEQDFAWYRAVWIECGELIDHYGYKWWKKQTPDMDQVELEVVDIWHFGMSALFKPGQSTEQLAQQITAQVQAHQSLQLDVLAATEALACDTLQSRSFSVATFMQLLDAVGMDLDKLYLAYVGKNVLNFFRQDNGYKEGSYRKVWEGREDNEHLTELLAQLDSNSYDLRDELYQALSGRYQRALQSA